MGLGSLVAAKQFGPDRVIHISWMSNVIRLRRHTIFNPCWWRAEVDHEAKVESGKCCCLVSTRISCHELTKENVRTESRHTPPALLLHHRHRKDLQSVTPVDVWLGTAHLPFLGRRAPCRAMSKRSDTQLLTGGFPTLKMATDIESSLHPQRD